MSIPDDGLVGRSFDAALDQIMLLPNAEEQAQALLHRQRASYNPTRQSLTVISDFEDYSRVCAPICFDGYITSLPQHSNSEVGNRLLSDVPFPLVGSFPRSSACHR